MSTISTISMLALPLFICFVVVYGMVKKVKVYEAFIKGAKSGISTAFRVLPYIVAMIFAVDIFKAAGCFEYISTALKPVIGVLHIPPEVLPLALMRPFSGGASMGMLAGLFTQFGPDSFIGRVASTLMGSSETLFYTVSLYYGSIGVENTRHTIPAAILSDVSGLIASTVVCLLVFGAAG